MVPAVRRGPLPCAPPAPMTQCAMGAGGAPQILEKISRGGIEMAYSKEAIDEVLAYLDEGHSARDAERRFGVSHESAARWRRKRDGKPIQPS